MSDATTPPSADRQAIRGAAAEIAAGCEESERFFTRLFDELDLLLADLTRRHDAWVKEQRSAGERSEALREQIHRWERREADWERDRAVLESELASVRGQAAELAETLADEKRHMETRQSEWTQEFRQMRRLLEMMARRQIEQQLSEENRQPVLAAATASAGSTGSAASAAAPAPAAPATAGDPVLDSVMAQFEMLQKDLARRRRPS